MPEWKNIVEARIAALRLAPAAARDLSEELAQHLEDRYRELRGGGAGEEEARHVAIEELADMEAMRTFERRYRPQPEAPAGHPSPAGFFDGLRKDLAYAVRTMRRSPVFVLTVVLTLGLGIGANTTVFTVIDTLLLNPLPVPESGRLAAVVAVQSGAAAASKAALPISWLNLKDYQASNGVFSSLAGFTSPRVLTMQENSAPDRIFAELVTGNYFSTLGLRPATGRFFLPEEDGVPGAHPVAVMNYATWQTRFGGAPDVVGKTMRLNNVDFTIVGVAPPEFIGINALFGPNLWIPAAMAEQLLPNEMKGILADRSRAIFTGIGRLKPGVSRAQAQANIATIAAALQHQYPEADSGHAAAVRPMIDIIFGSAASGTSPVLFASVVLVVVVGIVLLIACSNVANLLLARSAARRHELAVRLAMGASRPRLIRQLLSESLLLGLLSGLAGLFIGYFGVRALWSFLPSSDVSTNFIMPRMDPLVLAFTLLASLATGFAFGILPAWRASRVDPGDSLKEEGRNVGRSRRRITFANALLVGQVAFSFLLLVLAALFLRSIGRAYQIDPGFQTQHLVVLLTSPGQAGYDQARSKAFYKDVRTQVSALPGVASVSWASNLPLWGRAAAGLVIEGRAPRSRADTLTSVVNTVDLNYFDTAGTAIRQGRAFNDSDRADSTPVAIVNEKLAHDFWSSQSALGKRIQLPGETRLRQIVGVARTADYTSLNESPQFCVYVPLEQKYSDSMTLYVRSQGDAARTLSGIERVVAAAGPGILARDIRTGQEIMRDGLFGARVGVTMLTIFGLLALALASLGLYGIMAYSVEQRTREIGVRMALGAGGTSVLGLILKQGMSLVATGVLLGFIASLAAGRLLTRALYGITAGDPVSVGGAALVLLVVALAACYLPARRASRLDPLAALREG
jgi:predicted permease